MWDQVQYELATRHGDIKTSKVGLFSTRLKCGECGAWYGRKTWASTTKYKYMVWRCNAKYDHDQPCQTATLRDEQIQDAFLQALNQLIEQHQGQSRLPETITAMFDTAGLEADSASLDEKIRDLADEIEELIAENQRVAQDQDLYHARYAALDAKYQKTIARKQSVDAEIAARQAKLTAIKTAYKQLDDKPVERFQPSQWTALIDHAVVGESEIRFVFRTGVKTNVSLGDSR